MTYLVAQPVRQHSRHLAQALHAEGLLFGFFTFLPDFRALGGSPLKFFGKSRDTLERNILVGIPVEKVVCPAGAYVLLGLLKIAKTGLTRSLAELILWTGFDHWVARNLNGAAVDCIIGYEMCCKRTFIEGKRRGLRCILDAAALNADWVRSHSPICATLRLGPLSHLLDMRKKVELEFADLILCPSDFAKSTYIAQGVPSNKIRVVSLGYEKEVFYPVKRGKSVSPEFTFCYVGQVAYHKGTDFLINAFCRLVTLGIPVRLKVIGPLVEKNIKIPKCIEYMGRLGQPSVAKVIADSDCVVIPSLVDSFCMVLVESLACGVPVLTTNTVGAAHLIRDGYNGWIASPGDIDDLYRAMLHCIEHKEKIPEMRANCIESVADLTWGKYRARVLQMLI